MKLRPDAFCDWPTLPPPELYLYDIQKEGKIPTPVDESGLVDIKALVDTTIELVDQSYDWPPTYTDIHHLQWPASSYTDLPGARVNPKVFRELPINQVKADRLPHNVYHKFFEPPDVPSEEAMALSVEKYRVVRELFRSVDLSSKLLTDRWNSDVRIQRGLVRHFENFSKTIEHAQMLPEEFQPLELIERIPQSVDDMLLMHTILGKAALISTISLPNKKARLSSLLIAA